ncbi:MAG: arsenate reductase (glutaredoxin) [Myxococcota bacterium]
MSDVTIWHNPRCSKSRQTLGLLEERGIEPEVIEYLENPPSQKELDRVLKLLGLEPRELMRKKEAPYRELGLDDPSVSRQQLLDAMVKHPVLIERPVVIRGNQARVGRPPEKVLEIL